MMQSTRQLHEELAWLSAQLEAARDLERAAEERHSDEGMVETETALEGRREEVLRLRERRTRLVKELNRRAVAEKGWEPDRNQGGEALPGTGRAGRLRMGPHPLLPERGYVIYDRARATVVWVRRVPTPTRAEELLREHGVLWEGELLAHVLSLVPEGEEEMRGKSSK
jgi:hypothetical protein